jgi:hypothetical protein
MLPPLPQRNAGVGPAVFRDLMDLAPEGHAVAQDVVRWLRGVSDVLVKQPRCGGCVRASKCN